MTYKKDPKIKYWEMAKYIDDHVRLPDCDEGKCFEYMYHLFYVLAVKGKMFQKASDYDSYALYGATQLFVRYRKENINPDLKPIKSSLNYIKKILYPCRVDYQQAYFSERFTDESLQAGTTEQLTYDNEVKARSSNSDLVRLDTEYCLSQMAATLRVILNQSPYRQDPVMMHNLYLSCLLTLTKSLTFSSKNASRIQSKLDRHHSVDTLMEQVYAQEALEDVVLFHLDRSLQNYVDTQVKKLKHQMAKDLRYIIGSYNLSDAEVRDILTSPMGDCNPDASRGD